MSPQWTVRRVPRAGAVKLYVFPHSGGSPGEYVRWADDLPEVEVVGLQPPGRGGRLAEPPLTSMDELVAAIVASVRFEPPYRFFGHSLGGLVANEVALTLREQGRPLPESLVVSSIPAPHHGLYRDPLHHLPDAELVAAADERYGGGFAELATEPELLELVLPGYRADLQIYETYRWRPRPPLDVPIQVFGGRDDAITAERLGGWSRHTTAACALTMLPGGHFYLREAPGRGEVLAFLRSGAGVTGPASAAS